MTLATLFAVLSLCVSFLSFAVAAAFHRSARQTLQQATQTLREVTAARRDNVTLLTAVSTALLGLAAGGAPGPLLDKLMSDYEGIFPAPQESADGPVS